MTSVSDNVVVIVGLVCFLIGLLVGLVGKVL